MLDINKLILVGRLGADPEERPTKTGLPRVRFPLATSRRAVDSASSESPETTWHRVVVLGPAADFCRKHLRKGDAAYVEGEIRSRPYTDKEGVRRQWTEVTASRVSALGNAALRDVDSGPTVPAEGALPLH